MSATERGNLFVVGGMGERHAVSRAAAERYDGYRVDQALDGLINTEIEDKELLAILGAPELALELAGESPDGGQTEQFLSPRDDWRRVLDRLEQADCELGMARSHQGGRRN